MSIAPHAYVFRDRADAGRQLAERLDAYAADPRVIVLGLPRGGVIVAAEVAATLGAPLDVCVVRKLGVPDYPELAMGAIALGGSVVLVPDTIRRLGIDRQQVNTVLAEERAELARREAAYRGARPFPDLQDRTVIIVDDGVATGATMLAAVGAVRAKRPRTVIAAAPVMSRQAWAELRSAVHECEAVIVPSAFGGVGLYYDDFAQTTDDEVRRALGHAPGDSQDGVASVDRHTSLPS